MSIHHTGSGELDITSVGKQKQATQGGTGHHSESKISASKKKIVRFGQGEGRSLEEDAEWSEPQVKDSGVDTGSSTTLNEEHSLASKVRQFDGPLFRASHLAILLDSQIMLLFILTSL